MPHTVLLMLKSAPPRANQIGEFCHNYHIKSRLSFNLYFMIVASKFDKAGFYDQTTCGIKNQEYSKSELYQIPPTWQSMSYVDQDSVSTPVSTGSPTSLETILQNSSHGKNITVCTGIFMICFRKHKNYKTFNNNTLSYFHGVQNLCITCHLAIFVSFSSPSFH